jgi:GrpB-like predicted nucleotidyltransferase (UPF0157 family)
MSARSAQVKRPSRGPFRNNVAGVAARSFAPCNHQGMPVKGQGADEPGDFEARLRAVTIGEPSLHSGPIVLVAYDDRWPDVFRTEAERVLDLLGDRALRIEHVGSTSVPGLAAKPIIDMLLAVADSADERAYVPPLEAAGYKLRIREPGWYEHRLLKGPAENINLHVFSDGCKEIDRMLMFRDRLRADAGDRELYLRTKQDLAARSWEYVQHYADAKSAVVEAIIERAAAAARGRPTTTV